MEKSNVGKQVRRYKLFTNYDKVSNITYIEIMFKKNEKDEKTAMLTWLQWKLIQALLMLMKFAVIYTTKYALIFL